MRIIEKIKNIKDKKIKFSFLVSIITQENVIQIDDLSNLNHLSNLINDKNGETTQNLQGLLDAKKVEVRLISIETSRRIKQFTTDNKLSDKNIKELIEYCKEQKIEVKYNITLQTIIE